MRRAAAAVLAIASAVACDSEPTALEYAIGISFNDNATGAGIDEVSALLQRYDNSLDVRVLESSPPVLRATVVTSRQDLCAAVLALMFTRRDVALVTCDLADDARS